MEGKITIHMVNRGSSQEIALDHHSYCCTLIPIICFIVTVGRAENVRFITPEALKELIEKKDANFLIVDTQPKVAYKLGSSISPGKSELWIWLGLRLGCA